MRCLIRWIDDTGRSTEDDNPATCIAVWTHWDNLSDKGDEPDEVRRFPCCAKHELELDKLVKRGIDIGERHVGHERHTAMSATQWTKEPLT